MKLVILDTADFWGGAEFFLEECLPSWAKKEKVYLIHPKKIPRVLSESIHEHILDFPRLRPFRPIAFCRALWKLRKLIAQLSPDILYTNSVRGGIFAALSGAKHWTHFVHDATTPSWCLPLFQRASAFFVVSEWIRKDLLQKGIPEEKMTVVPNFLPKELPRKLPPARKESSRKSIGIIGRIDPWKGHALFLEIAQKMPENDFYIIGEADKHDPKTTEQASLLRKNAKENVQFLGFLPREEAFSRLDVVLHLSQQPEPFGRVILEALAFGVPIFSTTNEITAGPLFEAYDVSSQDAQTITKRLRAFFSNECTERTLFLERAQARILDFEEQRILQKMDDIWTKILS